MNVDLKNMKTKQILAGTILSIVLTTNTFAQIGTNDTQMPPPPKKPGMMGEYKQERTEDRKDFREERKEDMKAVKENMLEAKESFKEAVKEKRAYMLASTTATGTKPTPWKDLNKDMKEIKKEYMGDRKDDRQDFRQERRDDRKELGIFKPKPLDDNQKIVIAGKLGITVEALAAQLASGTKLKELVKDKITPEEMKQILPPKVATFTRAIIEKGFFNNFRSRIFGERKEMVKEGTNEFGEVVVDVSEDESPKPFWKKFFNF